MSSLTTMWDRGCSASRLRALIAATAIVLLMACGGSGDGSTVPDARPASAIHPTSDAAPTALPTRHVAAASTPKRHDAAAPVPNRPAKPGYYRPHGWDGYSDVDCGDFETHAQAQSFFLGTGGSRRNDPYRLDADHDLMACETLP
jgi:hypothetical protein